MPPPARRAAAAEADLILFVVDAREGTRRWTTILAWLRAVAPDVAAINKIDGTDEDSPL